MLFWKRFHQEAAGIVGCMFPAMRVRERLVHMLDDWHSCGG